MLGISDLGFQARFQPGFQHLCPRFQLVADPRSSTASHTPHTSVDLHPTTAVVSHGLVYSVAGVTPTIEHTTIPSASHATSRLPKLSIPTFTGDPLNWQSFWDCFDSAVNSNPTLSNVQKLSYLRAQLQGDASRVVAGFPLTNTSYSQSITLLRDRFGQPYKIVNAHLQALLHLPNPSNTLASLQVFHDSVEGHIRSLTSLGKSVDSYGDLLVSIILEKLPAETRKHLARERSNSDWTLQELQDAILKEIIEFSKLCYLSHHAPPLPHSILELGEFPQEISPRREVASSAKELMPP